MMLHGQVGYDRYGVVRDCIMVKTVDTCSIALGWVDVADTL